MAHTLCCCHSKQHGTDETNSWRKNPAKTTKVVSNKQSSGNDGPIASGVGLADRNNDADSTLDGDLGITEADFADFEDSDDDSSTNSSSKHAVLTPVDDGDSSTDITVNSDDAGGWGMESRGGWSAAGVVGGNDTEIRNVNGGGGWGDLNRVNDSWGSASGDQRDNGDIAAAGDTWGYDYNDGWGAAENEPKSVDNIIFHFSTLPLPPPSSLFQLNKGR
jgi:hypothetical protein